jgi:hypothetical protein
MHDWAYRSPRLDPVPQWHGLLGEGGEIYCESTSLTLLASIVHENNVPTDYDDIFNGPGVPQPAQDKRPVSSWLPGLNMSQPAIGRKDVCGPKRMARRCDA